ncbi:hypothetical protein DMH01_41440 [Amycolatopsis sp. WAC 04182]|nr:hypothetical protein DMH01_41440 [Amycolatopsis sp. WAC 04182]
MGAFGAPLFFPSSGVVPSAPDVDLQPSDIALDPIALQAMSRDELCEEVLRMLACLRRQSVQEVAAGAQHTDGTLALDSMTAVWVISRVGTAFGRHLVRLSEVEDESLRSVGTVAALIRQSIAPTANAGAA